MSVNSSSSSNSTVDFNCDKSIGFFVLFVFNGVRFFLLFPTSFFIFYQACQQWWRQRSFNTASHSDVFTYHQAAMELIWGFGVVLFYAGLHSGLPNVMTTGYFFMTFIITGEMFFHVLTCLDRYMAVVHPVTYGALRNSRGAMIRNISTSCAWLLSFLSGCVLIMNDPRPKVALFFCVLGFSVAVVSFCSVCVLWTLLRPAPGEGRRKQTNQRALFIVMAIMGVLGFWFTASLVETALATSTVLNNYERCIFHMNVNWFSLPGSLLLPLLYLRKTGKLSCGRRQSG